MDSYKNLKIWHKSKDVAIEVYRLTKDFPKDEKFGLTSQMKRAAVSMASNIAEGKMRGSPKEFKRFLYIVYSSGAE